MTVDPRIPVPRFKLGDQVEISSFCKFYGDWRGEKMTIVGLEYSRDQTKILYTTLETDVFHALVNGTADRRTATGRTDEWEDADLTFSS